MAAGQFDISIRGPSGKHELVTVNSATTVQEIKTRFSRKVQIPLDQYRLVFAGRTLSNNDTLAVSCFF